MTEKLLDRKTYIAGLWLASKIACEKAGYDGSVEHHKCFMELAEPELLMWFKDTAEIEEFAMKEKVLDMNKPLDTPST